LLGQRVGTCGELGACSCGWRLQPADQKRPRNLSVPPRQPQLEAGPWRRQALPPPLVLPLCLLPQRRAASGAWLRPASPNPTSSRIRRPPRTAPTAATSSWETSLWRSATAQPHRSERGPGVLASCSWPAGPTQRPHHFLWLRIPKLLVIPCQHPSSLPPPNCAAVARIYRHGPRAGAAGAARRG
jgi:hypothetical protein